jgi:serine protease Do
MGPWKAAAWTAAILAATGLGAAVTPPARAQVKIARARQAGPVRVQVLAGGSWIGVSVRDVAADDVSKMKLSGTSGVVVEEVSRESPAETAGFKPGDVILEFDGERVRSARQFTRLVQETPTGRKVQTSVLRDGQRVPLSVEPRSYGRGDLLDDRDFPKNWVFPPKPPAPAAPPMPPEPPMLKDFPELEPFFGRGSARLGVTVSDLQPQLAEYFGVKDGVLVTSVTSDSAASKAGVKAGDVITTLNGSAVTSPSDLRQHASRLQDGEELTIGVMRDKKSLTLKGKFEGAGPRRRTYTVL